MKTATKKTPPDAYVLLAAETIARDILQIKLSSPTTEHPIVQKLVDLLKGVQSPDIPQSGWLEFMELKREIHLLATEGCIKHDNRNHVCNCSCEQIANLTR